ncbi:Asp/Glu racemase [Falsochrobactrum shanghaiense]|uniref:Asp/Glu racemase n=1 Tax=Falsochrobactrum shanghaiense TaxID=2201899 RepID=A0A316JE43_9HYPH|nr:aspartate/glutamate racemase family protein [Falsochrobactrum shanghaiense]PWL19531.1 Asp/Glu racemase [Falsochrobactrum shanghaiense]
MLNISPFCDLVDPVGVFDAGIGSYAMVDLIRRRQPERDILYFADRASFPYGAKSREELLAITRRSVDYLAGLGAGSVVLASNAPSIMVLDALKSGFALPVHGVAPPVRAACSASRSGKVAIMGVRSMIDSAELPRFVRTQTDNPENVALINASAMVELVENGAFLREPELTTLKVTAFCDEIAACHPEVDALTLSSTHLPWLRPFFENARPGWQFFDPADDVVAALPHLHSNKSHSGKPHSAKPQGATGRTVALVTESAAYPVDEFRRMLALLGVDLPLTVVSPLSDMHV